MKLGKAFSDNLIVEQSVRRVLKVDETRWWHGAGRALIFASVLVGVFFILIVRLIHLTVIRGHELRTLADGNRTRELIRHAPRGILLDRTGKPLTTNQAQYRLIKPCDAGQANTCTTILSVADGEQLLKKGLRPGWFVEVDYARSYPYGPTLAHVIGYTGELSPHELSEDYYQVRQYVSGDRVGRMGAEAVYEEKLRGRNGKELVEVNAQGKILRTLGRDQEIPGQNVTLSLDAELSNVVSGSFPQGEKGAVIVSKPSTGEILALYSSPSFNPNAFSSGMSAREYDDLTQDPDQPMFPRAIGGMYPPGSTFKIVTALAALEEGAIKKDTIVEDNGTLSIGPYQFPNWYFVQYGKTEGPLDIVKAIKRSNDIFFYKASEWLGITKFNVWARKVGIGKPLGIELSGEASGLMPDPSWKYLAFSTEADKTARNNEWYLGDTYHVAIGQGYLLTTPLQVNAWTNVIASGGKLCKPTIQKATGDMIHLTSGCKDLGIKKETIQLITEGMREACAPGGTGWPLFNFQIFKSGTRAEESPDLAPTPEASASGQKGEPMTIPVACKTGTAEFGDPKNRTHAWFTAFAPLPKEFVPDTGNQAIKPDQIITGDPEISVTVLVEGAGEGSNVGAPIAKKIFEAWFGR